MSDLIERLESAPEGSRELDEDIAQELYPRLHRKGVGDFEAWYIDDMLTSIEHYTTSIDAALTLVAGLTMPGYTVIWVYGGMGNWIAAAAVGSHGDKYVTHATTPALALCAAALKARS